MYCHLLVCYRICQNDDGRCSPSTRKTSCCRKAPQTQNWQKDKEKIAAIMDSHIVLNLTIADTLPIVKRCTHRFAKFCKIVILEYRYHICEFALVQTETIGSPYTLCMLFS